MTSQRNSDDDGVRLEDFHAYMPKHQYIFGPSGDLWPASSVDARVAAVPLRDANGNIKTDKNGQPETILASKWIDTHRPVEQIVWAPALPQRIEDRLVSDGGWIERSGCACFNLYRPTRISKGDARKAQPWLDHVARVYPNEAEHIVSWLAHRVQRPHEKINHAVVMGGMQGIGKDSILEPIKSAIGPWNFAEVSPTHLLGRFNGFVRSVILRISEARDLGDLDRYTFYDRLKIYTAAPPDVLRVDEKNLREYAAWNVCGVVITTNHKSDGLFLPADDRRHFVAWSDLTQSEVDPLYFQKLYRWFAAGGDRHVAAYLASRDLSGFDPKSPPPKTAAFWDMVDANRAPEDAELADAFEQLGSPTAVTLAEISANAGAKLATYLDDRRNSRQIPRRLESAGYVAARNPDSKDGLWRIDGRRQMVYVKQTLLPKERVAMASDFVCAKR
ncbi:MAG TPA: primase-helicase family protein [Vicinamibacterales bacterium]|nr:primase-helicase family protein [Vicinamibacterales bacterium]